MRTLLRLSITRWLSAAVAAATLFVAAPAPASAQFGGVVVDLRNLAQNVAHYRVRLQQFTAQKQQLQNQLTAMRKLANPNWRDLGRLAQQLDQVVTQARGISYTLADAERLFRETFPGHTPPAGGWTAAHQRVADLRTMNTLQGVVAASSVTAQDIRGAMVTLNQIKARMASAQGQQQALELQTTMQGFAADQAAMLRQAVVMQAQAYAVVQAHELQQRATAEAVRQAAAQRMAAYRPASSGGFSGTQDNAGGRP